MRLIIILLKVLIEVGHTTYSLDLKINAQRLMIKDKKLKLLELNVESIKIDKIYDQVWIEISNRSAVNLWGFVRS